MTIQLWLCFSILKEKEKTGHKIKHVCKKKNGNKVSWGITFFYTEKKQCNYYLFFNWNKSSIVIH